jgi:hypothetical protein
MITYKKTDINANLLRLLKKLPAAYGISNILLDLENKYISAVEVRSNGELAGIIILRGEIDRQGEMGVILLHAIAENNIPYKFTDVLAVSVVEWLQSLKSNSGQPVFKWLRQDADSPALARILSKFYGNPSIYCFRMEIWDNKKEAIALHHKQHLKLISRLPLKAEAVPVIRFP